MNWVQRKIYLYNVTFGLYMLDWWERCLFNILVVVLMWFICYNGVRSANEFYKRCINCLCELWLEICSFECRTHFKGVFIGLMVGASSQLPSIFNFHIVWLPITGFYGDFKSHMNLESSG